MRLEPSAKDQYLNKLFAINDPVLAQIESKLKADDRLGINIGPHELSLLNYIIKCNNIKSVLEVGTLYAYSTYGMALSLPADGSIHSLEKDPSIHRIASNLIKGSPQEHKITLTNCDAKNFLQEHSKTYDLIFIDANKSGYMDYLDLSLKRLNPGGTIIGDNTFLFGNVYGEGQSNMSDKNIEIMKQFNKTMISNPDYIVTMIPSREGMTIIKKLS